MSTEADKRRMEAQDPQPGMSTFDRNHPATWRRHDPMNKRVEQREASLRLRQRAPQIEAGDKLTALLMIDAAVLLDQATFAESIWEDRARKAEHRLAEIERLRAERDEARDEVSLLRSTVTDRNIEIKQLRKERDETTASLDALLLIQAAQAHGFDCFKEDCK